MTPHAAVLAFIDMGLARPGMSVAAGAAPAPLKPRGAAAPRPRHDPPVSPVHVDAPLFVRPPFNPQPKK
jgi:hypothetical protein